MRRILTVSLLLFIILFTAGCNNKINKAEETMGPSRVYMYTDKNKYPSDVHEINVVWKNDTDTELTFGDDFSIQKLGGKEWNKIRDKEVAFNTIGYIVSPHTEMKHSYNIRVYSDKLEKGSYRIVTDYLNVHSPGNYDTYIIYANFTVE